MLMLPETADFQAAYSTAVFTPVDTATLFRNWLNLDNLNVKTLSR